MSDNVKRTPGTWHVDSIDQVRNGYGIAIARCERKLSHEYMEELSTALSNLIADWERVYGPIPEDHEAKVALRKAEEAPIGCRIAARLTDSLNSKVPVPYPQLQRWIYEELEEIGHEQALGDWIEMPNGTTYTLTFKPKKGAA